MTILLNTNIGSNLVLRSSTIAESLTHDEFNQCTMTFTGKISDSKGTVWLILIYFFFFVAIYWVS